MAPLTDVLIRNVPDDELQYIDERAAALGLSRGEYLRRQIAKDAVRGSGVVTPDQFAKFTDLADEDLMRGAWS
ncbi:type II toxin-antitoxin system VapB family antitoxin [Saccharomonospora iraqiensis]|uniref:type II toxin-antitoxin system VapB family antitoxin n=1 Tax=Saccharomonospora iraqiensis TaxID=52698 RepID=UPI0018DD1832|nr:hypothetical protein [Saccharomonospora iraqiensis]